MEFFPRKILIWILSLRAFKSKFDGRIFAKIIYSRNSSSVFYSKKSIQIFRFLNFPVEFFFFGKSRPSNFDKNALTNTKLVYGKLFDKCLKLLKWCKKIHTILKMCVFFAASPDLALRPVYSICILKRRHTHSITYMLTPLQV